MKKHFKVESYFTDLEPWMQAYAYVARELILQAHPQIQEGMKYNCPFYTLNGLMFYLSLFKKKQFVMGFCNGVNHPDPAGILQANQGQTYIKHWEFKKEEEPNWELLAEYIQMAVYMRMA